jgi:hypothetical protein
MSAPYDDEKYGTPTPWWRRERTYLSLAVVALFTVLCMVRSYETPGMEPPWVWLLIGLAIAAIDIIYFMAN